MTNKLVNLSAICADYDVTGDDKANEQLRVGSSFIIVQKRSSLIDRYLCIASAAASRQRPYCCGLTLLRKINKLFVNSGLLESRLFHCRRTNYLSDLELAVIDDHKPTETKAAKHCAMFNGRLWRYTWSLVTSLEQLTINRRQACVRR